MCLTGSHLPAIEGETSCQLFMENPRGFLLRDPEHIIFTTLWRLPHVFPSSCIFPSKTCNSLWINTAVDLLVNAVFLKVASSLCSRSVPGYTMSTLWEKGRLVSDDCPM